MKNSYDLDEQAAWLDSLKIGKFDSSSLMLAAKIGREIRRRSGEIVSLRDKNVVPELGRAVIKIGEPDLDLMYRTLLEKVVISEPEVLQSRKSGSQKKSKTEGWLRSIRRSRYQSIS